ncbi:MAG TPA: S1-like domain-containing RNA-binding protein [Fibrobacteraceae bacterium]|nr:S1-like domain-containing RNA-binding protein [Fibrobacteraceae bacterium]
MNRCKVVRQIAYGLVLADSTGAEVLLPNRYCPEGARVGSSLEVFVYCDSEDRPVATTQEPLAMVDEFAALQVKEVNRTAAFLDWGLDKDLMLPFREQTMELRPGNWCVVRIYLDQASNRLVCSQKLKPWFDTDTRYLRPGDVCEVKFYERHEHGILAVVDGRWSGLLFEEDIPRGLGIGSVGKGWIKTISPEGRIRLSMTSVGYKAVMEEAQVVLDRLVDAGGFLPFHDQSDPDEIRRVFGLSKKAFKKIIGGLFKAGQIHIGEDGIRLVEPHH